MKLVIRVVCASQQFLNALVIFGAFCYFLWWLMVDSGRRDDFGCFWWFLWFLLVFGDSTLEKKIQNINVYLAAVPPV